jgi:hypothetical protein
VEGAISELSPEAPISALGSDTAIDAVTELAPDTPLTELNAETSIAALAPDTSIGQITELSPDTTVAELTPDTSIVALASDTSIGQITEIAPDMTITPDTSIGSIASDVSLESVVSVSTSASSIAMQAISSIVQIASNPSAAAFQAISTIASLASHARIPSMPKLPSFRGSSSTPGNVEDHLSDGETVMEQVDIVRRRKLFAKKTVHLVRTNTDRLFFCSKLYGQKRGKDLVLGRNSNAEKVKDRSIKITRADGKTVKLKFKNPEDRDPWIEKLQEIIRSLE